MKKIAIVTLMTAFIAAPVFASEAYIGLGAGQNKMDITDAKTSTAFSLYGGYSFNEYVAAELGYVNFGSADTDSAIPVTLKGSAASISAVGSLPLARSFSLFAKLGYASTTLEASFASASTSQTKSDVTYGVGGQFNVSRNVGIRLAYDSYKVGDTNTRDSALTSVSVLFKF